MQQQDDLNLNIISRVAMGDVLRRRSRDATNSEALIAFVDGERQTISYRDLNNRVNQIGRGLRAHGLQQGDRIALVSGNSIDFVAVLFACYKTGIVAVPVNFLQQADDVRYNFEHAEVKAIVYQDVLEDLCCQCAMGLDTISLKVSIGNTNGAAQTTLDALADSQVCDEIMDVIINDRDVAQILYTSGTTSRPKGVETSHLALVLSSMNTPINLDMRKGCASLSVLPLFHVTAICGLHSCMQVSGKYVIHTGFDADAVVDTLEQESIGMTVMLPMMWNACLAVPGMTERDYSSITAALYGMAPMSGALLARLRQAFGCDFHLGSGQTEFTPIPCIYYDHSPTEFGEGNYWGVATSIAEQAVLDDNGNECAAGEVGEICWRGPLSMNGYLKNPEATAEVRLHGWHHSGDLGFIDTEGQLMFVDRKKDIIKTGGENVSSCKVEGVLTAIEGIVLSAVVGVPHPHWSEAICAVVQLIPGTALTEDDVIIYCKQHLGGFEVPKRVIFVDAIELTSTGKVKKPELRKQYAGLFSES
ncbi:MAG: AMP-binding protein [Oceanicoccus sp.]